MKYKEQSTDKLDKIESQIRFLEMAVNRSLPLENVHNHIGQIRELLDKLRDNINAEQDDWD